MHNIGTAQKVVSLPFFLTWAHIREACLPSEIAYPIPVDHASRR